MREHGRIRITAHGKHAEICRQVDRRVQDVCDTLAIRNDNKKLARMQRNNAENTMHNKLLFMLWHLAAEYHRLKTDCILMTINHELVGLSTWLTFIWNKRIRVLRHV